MPREGRHRISLDIPVEMFKEIQKQAKKRNITLTMWMKRSFTKSITEEKKYD